MTDDTWTMADGFAPVSRLDYCKHPRACSAPQTGACSRCQKPPSWVKRARLNFKHPSKILYPADATPTYLDEDFDTWGAQ